jgi:alpha-galactosidase
MQEMHKNLSYINSSVMAEVAAHIKSLGPTPGLWLAPRGQSNPSVVSNSPNIFLLKPDGSTASDTWEGRYLVDPSTPESLAYMNDLLSRLTDWGYEYFKIDGQPIVVDEYREKNSS